MTIGGRARAVRPARQQPRDGGRLVSLSLGLLHPFRRRSAEPFERLERGGTFARG